MAGWLAHSSSTRTFLAQRKPGLSQALVEGGSRSERARWCGAVRGARRARSPNAEQMAGLARRRQPGLIRAPPAAALRFEVSRCRPRAAWTSLPPSRRSRAGGACLSRCGLGAGRGDPLSCGPSGTSKRRRAQSGPVGAGRSRAARLQEARAIGTARPSPQARSAPG